MSKFDNPQEKKVREIIKEILVMYSRIISRGLNYVYEACSTYIEELEEKMKRGDAL